MIVLLLLLLAVEDVAVLLQSVLQVLNKLSRGSVVHAQTSSGSNLRLWTT